jgi:hypothetical protein
MRVSILQCGMINETEGLGRTFAVEKGASRQAAGVCGQKSGLRAPGLALRQG